MSQQRMPVTWAIIGLGAQAEKMARAMQGSATSVLMGAVSHQQERARAFAAAYNLPHAATTLTELCGAQKPDVVLICSPTDDHVAQSLEAISFGCHVLCEKPMTLRVEDAHEIVRAAAQAGVRYGVGFHLRFHPLVQALRDGIRAGRLGTIQAVEAHWSVGRIGETSLTPLADPHKEWREDVTRSGGGASMARGTHLFDLIRFVTGQQVREVFAMQSPPAAEHSDLTSCILLRLESAIATVTTSRVIPVAQDRLVVYGSGGTVVLTDAFRSGGAGVLRWTDGAATEEIATQKGVDLYRQEMEAFSRHIGGAPWDGATAADGAAVVAATVAASASVRTGTAAPCQNG